MSDLVANNRPIEAKKSRVLPIGPGAIGLTAAAALLNADITLDIATRSRFEHLQVNGSDDLEAAFTVAVHTTAESIASYDGRFYDTVIVAVRTNQVGSISDWLQAAVGPDTIVLALQSGIDHEDRLRPHVLVSTPIIPAVVYTHSSRSEPGMATIDSDALIEIPRSPHAEEIKELFAGTFFGVEIADNFRKVAWRKMAINSSLGIMSGLTGKPPRAFADPEANRVLRALLDEATAVANADGTDLGEDFSQKLAEAIPRISPDNLPSIAADRAAGVETEWDAYSGTILRLGAQYSIPVPLHSLGTTLVRVGEPEY